MALLILVEFPNSNNHGSRNRHCLAWVSQLEEYKAQARKVAFLCADTSREHDRTSVKVAFVLRPEPTSYAFLDVVCVKKE